MGKTFSEKVLGKKAGKEVRAGEIVEIVPDFAMSHDNTAAISKTFEKIGVAQLYDPSLHVIILDHAAPAPNAKFAENHKQIREFVHKHGIPNFFDINRGICHQVMVEEGFALPGLVVVGSDSHSTTYGAVGAFGTGIGRSEMAVIMATGRIWLRVPETMKIVVKGKPPEGVSAKDIMLKIIGDLGADAATYMAVEFTGETIERMSLASRMVLSNMAVEMGAKVGYIPPDETTLEYVRPRARKEFEVIHSDPDATYAETHVFDVSDLEPQVACPHTVDNVKPISEVKGTKIHQVFFGSCTNARLEDFEVVANALKGRRVHPDVRMLVFPASQQVYLDALKKGYLQTILEAGAIVMNANCGPCMGNHAGIPAAGEVSLSTSNRNFRGRQGNVDAEVYLCSPLTAAASAIAGEIADFREVL
ncbi:MAG TPA: 3-isopropylmalate dehydratase large subunit [Bacteroidetes bacterium]|nr:3-isopropylmalate dehydratase large subunit [Bacteroidota bacterium]